MSRLALILMLVVSTGVLVGGSSPASVFEPLDWSRSPFMPRSPLDRADVEPVYLHFDAPRLDPSRRLSLWATHYSVARARALGEEAGVPLLDTAGRSLGVRVSFADFCRAALEGTVQVLDPKGRRRVFDYAGLGSEPQVDCSDQFPRWPALGRARFTRSRARFGEGSRGARMVPFRTIAVDPQLIPLGSLLYVPAARGTSVKLEKGETCVHDGYFYAADRGGAIDGNHVDVFIGTAATNPFSFVKSRPSEPFEAYVVDSPLVLEVFESAHGSDGLARADD